MKKVLVLLAVLAMTLGANAKSNKLAGEDYNRVEIGYTPMFASVGRRWDAPSTTLHGFQAGYVRGIHLSKKWPMYIEAGANLQFNRRTVEEAVYTPTRGFIYSEYPITMLRLNIPVSFTWRFHVGNKKQLAIAPYAGLNFGINLVYKQDGDNMFEDGILPGYSANRFQMGMVEGVNFTYKCWNAGIGYIYDFMALDEFDTPSSSVTNYTGSLVIKFGYEF